MDQAAWRYDNDRALSAFLDDRFPGAITIVLALDALGQESSEWLAEQLDQLVCRWPVHPRFRKRVSRALDDAERSGVSVIKLDNSRLDQVPVESTSESDPAGYVQSGYRVRTRDHGFDCDEVA